ncbi:L-rhamnose mutarotase [Halomontanus rarus]|uniref:L-rhamnose mutarotase n=1 Tax=Halomontanus rarus TaxID=3034020 RepID=UPI0023E88773|nr:L-rhamnose mutarotase [Halovivax sp. TS33]
MVADDTDHDRVAMIQHLDPDRVDEYLEAHENVPDAVAEQMRASGVETFELFVEDDISVGYLEVEDFERYVAEYSENPECEKWEREVGEYKRSGVETDDAEIPTMDHVWSLDDATE